MTARLTGIRPRKYGRVSRHFRGRVWICQATRGKMSTIIRETLSSLPLSSRHAIPQSRSCYAAACSASRATRAATHSEKREPRFLDQVADACRVKHLAYRTEQSYVAWVKRFILFHKKRHPREMGAPEVRAFLPHLARNRRVAASTQNQALNAIVFMYREVLRRDPGEFGDFEPAKRPKRLPTVLTREEVERAHASFRHVRPDGSAALRHRHEADGMCVTADQRRGFPGGNDYHPERQG